MIKPNTPTRTSLLLIGFATLILSACGVRGAPEIPPPLWGEASEERKGDTLPQNPTSDDEFDDDKDD